MGYTVAGDWKKGGVPPWINIAASNPNTRDAWGMVLFIAIFYWLLGNIRAVPLLIAVYALFTALTPVLVYKVSIQLGMSPKSAKFGAWLIALSPAFAFWSGALYKEGLILLLLLLGIYHVLLLQQSLRVFSLLIFAFCVIGLFTLRPYLSFL